MLVYSYYMLNPRNFFSSKGPRGGPIGEPIASDRGPIGGPRSKADRRAEGPRGGPIGGHRAEGPTAEGPRADIKNYLTILQIKLTLFDIVLLLIYTI